VLSEQNCSLRTTLGNTTPRQLSAHCRQDPREEKRYFKDQIEPHIGNHAVAFVGEVDERGKETLLGGAAALLFPIDWPEPFGLVMIEAMACGTPVIAWRRGSVPEVIEDGVTGFIVETEAEAPGSYQPNRAT
jgi:glycosyltransferase involved in cell wall biosynthesis